MAARFARRWAQLVSPPSRCRQPSTRMRRPPLLKPRHKRRQTWCFPLSQQVYAAIDSNLQSHRGQVLHLTSTATNSLTPATEYVTETYIDIANSLAHEVVGGNNPTAGTNVWFGDGSTVIQSPGGNTRPAPPSGLRRNDDDRRDRAQL